MNYAPEPIGIGRVNRDVVDLLVGAGAEVTVVTAPPHYPGWRVAAPYRAGCYRAERDRGARVVRCPLLATGRSAGTPRILATASFAFSAIPAVAWALLRQRPRLLICVEPALLSAVVPGILARALGIRSVLHVQDLEVDAAFASDQIRSAPARRLARAVERTAHRLFDRVVTISEAMRARLVRKGLAPERVAVVNNWVDLDRFRPLENRTAYRAELGIGDEVHVALYAGHVGYKQALQVLLEAAEALRGSGWLLVVVGEGPAKARLVERYGGFPNVRFLPFQPEARLNELLNAADVLVLPQERDMADLGLPSKLAGMLATSRPVLATVDPGTELHDKLQGVAMLVPAGDSAALARALLDFAHAPPALGDGRAVAASFGKERNGALLLALLADLLHGPRSRARSGTPPATGGWAAVAALSRRAPARRRGPGERSMSRKDDDVGTPGAPAAGGGHQTAEQAAITSQEGEGLSDAERNASWRETGGTPGRAPVAVGGRSGGHSDRKPADEGSTPVGSRRTSE